MNISVVFHIPKYLWGIKTWLLCFINCLELNALCQKRISPNYCRWSYAVRHRQCDSIKKYLSLSNPHLHSAFVDFLKLPSVTSNLFIIRKTFTLTHPNWETSKIYSNYWKILQQKNATQLYYITNETLNLKVSWHILETWHCVKSVRIRSYSGPYFPVL